MALGLNWEDLGLRVIPLSPHQSDNNGNTDATDLRGFLSRLRRDWDKICHEGRKAPRHHIRFNRLCVFVPSWQQNFAAGKAKSVQIRVIRVIRVAIIVALVGIVYSPNPQTQFGQVYRWNMSEDVIPAGT